MTYRWEPTTPLDIILATGFKRIDEAVEGVIARLAPDFDENMYSQYISECMADILDAEDSRVMDDMARRQAEGLQNQMSNAYRQGLGNNPFYAGIGDQHAHGSPMNLLGADYRNAFGGGL